MPGVNKPEGIPFQATQLTSSSFTPFLRHSDELAHKQSPYSGSFFLQERTGVDGRCCRFRAFGAGMDSPLAVSRWSFPSTVRTTERKIPGPCFTNISTQNQCPTFSPTVLVTAFRGAKQTRLDHMKSEKEPSQRLGFLRQRRARRELADSLWRL